MNVIKKVLLPVVLLVTAGTSAHASLIDHGNGLIYDDILDVTWLQNANLAESNTFGVSGIDPLDGGAMSWDLAFEWIAAMNASNYLGYHDWRMPTLTPVNGAAFQYTVSYDGSTDRGFNQIAETNELSHLYYVSLANVGRCSSANATGSPADTCVENLDWGLRNTGPFLNLVSGRFWTDTPHDDPEVNRAFDLDFNFGQMGTGGQGGPKYVWAMLDGDVTVVPVPTAIWLFGSGLLGLVGIGRRRNK